MVNDKWLPVGKFNGFIEARGLDVGCKCPII
jgi:hypothetical protein